MSSSAKLFQELGAPRGRVSVREEVIDGRTVKLVVWVAQGFPRSLIPREFDGLPVQIYDMPQFKAQSCVTLAHV